MIGTVKRFVEREVRPVARALEHAVEYPHALVEKMRELGLFGLGVWWLLARRADQRRLSRRLQRRAHAYRALLAHPERALAERGPSLRKRLFGAILIAAAASMTKRLILR